MSTATPLDCTSPDRVESLDERIDLLLSGLTASTLPGIAVGISVGGVPIYRKGFGLANMELPFLLSPTIRMRVGSVTKQFTAFAYLLLCEDREASLEDSIGKYFPEFHRSTHSVTVAQLLGHMGGIRDVCPIRFRLGGFEGAQVDTDELLSLYREIDDVDHEAQSTWAYNNGGYIIVGAIIEKITQQRLEEVLWRRVFSPIGMYSSQLRHWDTVFAPNSATPHTLAQTGKFEKRYWGLNFGGAGAMTSTVDDLLRWLAHMDSPVVGSSETWRLMKTPGVLTNGAGTGYALGLHWGEYRGLSTISHGGGWIGGNAQVLKVPSAKLDVVVMANRNDLFSPTIVNAILDVSVFECDPRESRAIALGRGEGFSVLRVDPTAAARSFPGTPDHASARSIVSGTFRSLTSRSIAQLFERNGRQIVSIDGYDLPFEHTGDRELMPSTVWSYFQRRITLLGPLAEPTGLRVDGFGNVEEYVRIPFASTADGELLVGEYLWDATGSRASIRFVNSTLVMSLSCRFGAMEYALDRLDTQIWRANSALSFLLDSILFFTDRYDAFYLTSFNVKELPFRRSA